MTLDKAVDDARRAAEHHQRVAATLAPLARSVSVLRDLSGALGPSAVTEALRHAGLASSRLMEIMASMPAINPETDAMNQALKDLDAHSGIFDAVKLNLPDAPVLQTAFQTSLNLQRIQLDWLDNFALLNVPASLVVSENLLQSSRLASDLAALAAVSRPRIPLGQQVQTVLQSAAKVATANQTFVRDSLSELAREPSIDRPGIFDSEGFAKFGVAIPTDSSARFVGSLRVALAPRRETAPSTPAPMAGQEIEAVAEVLKVLEPRFADLWEGAWYDLRSESPNWARNVSHAGRELLRQAIESLAADSPVRQQAVSDNSGRVTRKERVRWIVGGVSQSGAAWADAVAVALDQTYGLLSAEAHTEHPAPRFKPDAVAGLLESLGGLLRFLVYCRPESAGDH